MSTAVGLYRGTVTAGAFLFDLALIGESVARARVAELWQDGARLLQVSDGWLLVLATPVTVRADRAPGLVLRPVRGGLAGPGLTGRPGVAVWPAAGRIQEQIIDEAATVTPVDWFDSSALPAIWLRPLDRALPPPPPIPEPEPVVVDLRELAGVGAADLEPPLADRQHSRRPAVLKVLVALGVLGLVIGGALFLAGHAGSHHANQARPAELSSAPAPTPTFSLPSAVETETTFDTNFADPFATYNPQLETDSGSNSGGSHVFVPIGALISLLLLLIRGLSASGHRRARRLQDQARRQASGRRNWLARLVLGSPAKGVIGRRHRRYLDKVQRDFEAGNYQAALRNAIALDSSSAAGLLSLRVPRGRDALSLYGSGGATAFVPWGESVREHLRQLYLNAAARLEQTGDVVSAAFVHTILLNQPSVGVDLLERHGQTRTAAGVAEHHHLEPGLVVRLWWRAGDRARAIDVARRSHAFADGIARLELVDPGAARGLRAAWIWVRRQSGDSLGAVEAAWPDPELWSLVTAELRSARDRPGTVGAELLTYALAAGDDPADLAAGLEILRAGPTEAATALVTGLARRPAMDPVADRRLATAALAGLVADPDRIEQLGSSALPSTLRSLRRRADPLFSADLIRISPRPATGLVEARLPGEPGQLPLADAVALPDDRTLIALGSLGVRLLGPTGAEQARWDVPTERLIVADHGESALLVHHSGPYLEVSRLELRTRRVTRWTTLAGQTPLSSFDGSTLPVIDAHGLAFLDVLSDQPRVLWRELEAGYRIIDITRTATELTALLSIPTDGKPGQSHLSLWCWELPSMRLRVRRTINLPDGLNLAGANVAAGTALLKLHGPAGSKLLRVHGYDWPQALDYAVDETLFLATRGSAAVIGHLSPEQGCHAHIFVDGRPVAEYTGTPDVVLTEHAGLITLVHPDGRLVTIASDPVALRSYLRTRL